jgi:FkbM family methyltransferase
MDSIERVAKQPQHHPGLGLGIGLGGGHGSANFHQAIALGDRPLNLSPHDDLVQLHPVPMPLGDQPQVGIGTVSQCGKKAQSQSDVEVPERIFQAAAPVIIAQPVLVKTLDSCVPHRIDFIKIDVEGSELLVFRGAERILTTDRPVILVEINPANLLRTSGISATEFGEYVERLGYALFEIAADGSCGRRIRTGELAAIPALANVAMLPAERAVSAV